MPDWALQGCLLLGVHLLLVGHCSSWCAAINCSLRAVTEHVAVCILLIYSLSTGESVEIVICVANAH